MRAGILAVLILSACTVEARSPCKVCNADCDESTPAECEFCRLDNGCGLDMAGGEGAPGEFEFSALDMVEDEEHE